MELHRTADKLQREVDILNRQIEGLDGRTDHPAAVALIVSQTKKVRRLSNLVVRQTAAYEQYAAQQFEPEEDAYYRWRNKLQPTEGTSE